VLLQLYSTRMVSIVRLSANLGCGSPRGVGLLLFT
jgi:hypothetical protein